MTPNEDEGEYSGYNYLAITDNIYLFRVSIDLSS